MNDQHTTEQALGDAVTDDELAQITGGSGPAESYSLN